MPPSESRLIVLETWLDVQILTGLVYCVKLESMDAHTPFTFSVCVRSLPLKNKLVASAQP